MTSRSKKGLERPDFSIDDVASGLLTEIRLVAASVAEFSIGAGRGLEMEGPPYFFLVLEGECWWNERDGTPARLAPGDCLLALRGDMARLSMTGDVEVFDDIREVWRASGSPRVDLQGYDKPLRLVCGEQGSMCRLMGSALIFPRSASKSGLIREAPPVVHLRADETHLRHWAAAVSDTFKREDEDPGACHALASTALSQFLLIEQLKAYLARDHVRLAASIGAGERANIWRLIRRLQRESGQPWTIAEMARESAMSRTSFVQTFSELTGTTPFRYLAACRMDHAAGLLKEDRLTIEEIATLCGYQSPRAFRSAFHLAFGTTPREFRRASRSADEPPFPPPTKMRKVAA